MKEKITIQAPSRLILSGEHAVIYDQPALAMAVDQLAETTLTLIWQSEYNGINFHLSNLNYAATITLQKLRDLKHRLQDKYNKFLNGKCGICEVLQKPYELLQYAFIHIVDKLNIDLPCGLKIYTQSNIPIGYGMGSSAATIVSIMRAITGLLEIEAKSDDYLKLGRDVENLQHGYSSGLDLYVSFYGGTIRFEKRTITPRVIPKIPIYIVNTGRPSTTTGQCVNAVAKHFQDNKSLALDFGAVTDAFDKALQDNNLKIIQECVRANHQLLTYIGVVPEKVQSFIAEIEHQGAVGKISGGGAVDGENAGVLLVITETDITPLVNKYNYKMFEVTDNPHGIRII